MIAEALHLALSLPGIPLRHWRHAGEAVGLWARGRRQQQAWAPHAAQTKAAILVAMPEARRRVVVLGSGPLFDVPLHALSESFAEVVLLDRIHLFSARRQAQPNVTFLSRDLADGLTDVPPADWTISLNLLSQLAHGAAAGDERRVIGVHLRDLAARAGKATLITDTSFDVRNTAGDLIDSVDLLYGIDLPRPASRWSWEVAPFGEEAADRRRVHQVAAWPDWTAASLRAP